MTPLMMSNVLSIGPLGDAVAADGGLKVGVAPENKIRSSWSILH